MTIVLSGVLILLVGRDGFQQEAGAFSVLGIDSLAEQEGGKSGGGYDPDFSAAVWSDYVVRINIMLYGVVGTELVVEGRWCLSCLGRGAGRDLPMGRRTQLEGGRGSQKQVV